MSMQLVETLLCGCRNLRSRIIVSTLLGLRWDLQMQTLPSETTMNAQDMQFIDRGAMHVTEAEAERSIIHPEIVVMTKFQFYPGIMVSSLPMEVLLMLMPMGATMNH